MTRRIFKTKNTNQDMSQENINNSKEEYKQYKHLKEQSLKVIRKLTEKRKLQKITQKDIAKKSGLTQEAISRLENDLKTSPSLITLIKYADAINCEITITDKAYQDY